MPCPQQQWGSGRGETIKSKYTLIYTPEGSSKYSRVSELDLATSAKNLRDSSWNGHTEWTNQRDAKYGLPYFPHF